MNANEYQQLASRTECSQAAASVRRQSEDWGTTSEGEQVYHQQATRLSHAALGVSGEAGELCGAVERWLHYGQKLDKTNVAEELGDLMWYVALACNALGLSLEDVMEANIRKLRKRYPDKYTDEHALEENRDRNAERTVLEDESGTPIGSTKVKGHEANKHIEDWRVEPGCQCALCRYERSTQRSVEYEDGDK